MHVCVLISSALRTPVLLRPTWLTFTKHAHLFQDPISKHSHILRCCGQDRACECGGYMEPVAPPYLWDRFFLLGHTGRLLVQPSPLLDATDLGTFWCPLGFSWSDLVIWEPQLKLQHHWGEMRPRLCPWTSEAWPGSHRKDLRQFFLPWFVFPLSRSASHLEQKSM